MKTCIYTDDGTISSIMLKNILLVGGTGYLGRHLSVYLEKSGLEIFISGSRKSNQENYFLIDFEDSESYNSLNFSKFDLIVILAAKLNCITSTDLSHPDLTVNTTGYGTFLQYVKSHELTSKIVYISSMTVYAPPEQLPVREFDRIGPVSTYGLSKYIGECLTRFLVSSSDIGSVILRLPGIYGGDKKSGFIYNTVWHMKNRLPLQLSTNALVYWETIHIDDLCEMLTSFIKTYKWKLKYEEFNVCYGMETDFYETFQFIKNETNNQTVDITELKRGYQSFYLSNSKLKETIPVKEDYFGKLKEYIASL